MYGHLDPIRAIDIDPESLLVVTGSDDGLIKLWDLNKARSSHKSQRRSGSDYTSLYNLRGSIHRVTAVAYSPKQRRCFAGSSDGRVRVWDLPLDVHQPGSSSLNFSEQKMDEHQNVVWEIALHPQDPHAMATISADGTCRLWNTRDITEASLHQFLYLLPGSDAQSSDTNGDAALPPSAAAEGSLAIPTSVTFPASNPHQLLVGYENTHIRVYDTIHGTCALQMALDPANGYSRAKINKLTVYPSDSLLVAALEDQTLRFLDLRSGKQIGLVHAHLEAVTTVDVDYTGYCTVSASTDCTLRWWDRRTFNCVYHQEAHRLKNDEGIVSMRAHPRRPWVLTGGADAVVKVFTAG
ncbi:WD40-repeat-containing domain protein [Dimargaris cristalligena]|uniref:WD40-repeat-containing domain protein n=1 Tax=Dimargaris cristalligena TaxID=215637 RepID=A0A4P9ZUY2_9FUNG|nr:WD40-repeat-containing domain protein [Dimargaris cristalligena]|eukprot:RKP36721.1 WD40-repeat-containing domain protein [Dimargaris cristalligena]